MKKRIVSLLPVFILCAILGIAAYLRLYHINLYMTFLGDEGRDVLIVKRMIVDGKWTLLGPTASVGGFFMGPIYYYFMLPFLWLWKLNPVGPAIMVALVGILTTYLIYRFGKELFGERVGIIASSLYALSPLVISYSRSSWNPNIVPFFSLSMFYLLWRIITKKTWHELFWVGIIIGIGIQLHYTFLFVLPVLGIVCLWHGRAWERIKDYGLCILGFLIGFAPFLGFEVRHGFTNTKAIFSFIFEGKDTGFFLSSFVLNITDVYLRLFGRFLLRIPEKGALGNLPFWEKTAWTYGTIGLAVMTLVVLGLILYRFWKTKKNVSPGYRSGILLLVLWIGSILMLFGIYKKSIYDYYLGSMFFAPFFLIGIVLDRLFTYKIGKIVASALLLFLLLFNWEGRPFKFAPNNQLGQVELIAKAVVEKTDGKPFNFALITTGNSDHAYRYFFEIWGKPPMTIENTVIDPDRKTVTEQLLIVCEDIFCKPLGNSLWEVAGFGRAEIVGQWDVSVVKIYKLVHYKEEVAQ